MSGIVYDRVYIIIIIINRDVRSLKLLKKLKSHSDEVSAICLHPTNKEVWLTCGVDELLCQYDMTQDDVVDFSNDNLVKQKFSASI